MNHFVSATGLGAPYRIAFETVRPWSWYMWLLSFLKLGKASEQEGQEKVCSVAMAHYTHLVRVFARGESTPKAEIGEKQAFSRVCTGVTIIRYFRTSYNQGAVASRSPATRVIG